MRDRRTATQRYRDAFSQRDLVRELEDLAARAHPPLSVLELDGWRLRSGRGLSRAGNSVWPRAAGSRLPLDRRIEAVERFYGRRGLAACYRLSPAAAPAGLERSLRARGYAPTPLTSVQVADLEQLTDGLPTSRGGSVLLAAEPTPAWLHALPPGERAAAAKALARVQQRTAFAELPAGGGAASVARGVLDGGWVGLLDVIVAGDATADAEAALVDALARWAAARGAVRAYREGAAPLAGFRTAYEYRYRIATNSPARVPT